MKEREYEGKERGRGIYIKGVTTIEAEDAVASSHFTKIQKTKAIT